MTNPIDDYGSFDDAVRRVVDLAFSETKAEKIVFEAIKTDSVRLRDAHGQEWRYETTPKYLSFMGQVRSRRVQGRDVGRYDPSTRSHPGAERLSARPVAPSADEFRQYHVNLSDLSLVLQREHGLYLAEPVLPGARAAELPNVIASSDARKSGARPGGGADQKYNWQRAEAVLIAAILANPKAITTKGSAKTFMLDWFAERNQHPSESDVEKRSGRAYEAALVETRKV